jgi:hypothetical protein
MNRLAFWQHVDAARSRNSDDAELALRDELSPLSPDQLVSFQQHFDEVFDSAYRWDLWGAAYLIDGGCSDDGFIDFRYGLIAQGQHVFERALADPDSLVEIEDVIPNESYGYVVGNLLEEATGERYVDRYAQGPSEPVGEAWDFDDPAEARRRLPRLWGKFGT